MGGHSGNIYDEGVDIRDGYKYLLFEKSGEGLVRADGENITEISDSKALQVSSGKIVGTYSMPTTSGVVEASSVVVADANKYVISQYQIDTAAEKGPVMYFDGVNDYIEIADDANLDFGTGDFTLSIFIKPSSITTANAFIINKEDSGVGYGLEQRTNDIWLRFDDNNADATAIIGENILEAGVWSYIILTCDRDGNATLYQNGVLKGTVDISGSNLTLSNGGALRLGTETGGTTKPFGGLMSHFRMYHLAITQAQSVAWMAETDPAYKGGSQTPTYTSDFSVGADGISATRGTAAGNVDGVDGQDDNFRFTMDSTSGTHFIEKGPTKTVGKYYKITFSYYIPSGQSNIDGIQLPSTYWGGTTSTLSTVGAWTSVTKIFLATNAYIVMYALDGATTSFQDAGGDDVFYLKNIIVTQLGSTLDLQGSGIGPSQWLDSNPASNNGTNSGVTPKNLPRRIVADGAISLKEQAAADTDTAAYGQIWVGSSTPNELWFRDDAGTDTQISPHPLDAPEELYTNGPGIDMIDKRVQHYLGVIFWIPIATGQLTEETFTDYNLRRKNAKGHIDLVKKDWYAEQKEKEITKRLSEETEITEAQSKKQDPEAVRIDEDGKFYRRKTRDEIKNEIKDLKLEDPPEWIKNKMKAK